MSRVEDASGIRWLARAPQQATLLLCGLALLLVFFGLGRYSVVNADEALYHDIALQMEATGDWFRVASPRFHHVYDTFANAPLQYWMRGLVLSLIGDGLLAMRLSSSVAALLAVLATYRAVLHVAGRSAALLAGLLLLTNFQFLFLHSARTGELEPAVCLLFVCLAHIFTRCIEDRSRSMWVHHVCLALLFNLKAPVIAIPLLAELVCFAMIPAARRRFGDWLRTGVMILPAALAWHAVQAWLLRDMLAGVLAEVSSQAAGQGPGGFMDRLIEHGRYYAARIYFGAYPSVLLMPIALIAVLMSWRQRAGDEPSVSTGQRVWLIYALATFSFYLGISKLGPWYVVHAYPFLAALLAVWLVGLADRSASRVLLFTIASLAALGLWLRPTMAGYDPFAESAMRIAMPIVASGVWGWAVPFVAVGLFALLLWLSRRDASGFRQALPGALAAGLLTVALVRALLPLAHVDHLSPIASLHAEIEERLANDQPIPLPLELPSAHPWIVDHYFLRDFEIGQLRGGEADDAGPWPPRVLLARRSRPGPGRAIDQSAGSSGTP